MTPYCHLPNASLTKFPKRSTNSRPTRGPEHKFMLGWQRARSPDPWALRSRLTTLSTMSTLPTRSSSGCAGCSTSSVLTSLDRGIKALQLDAGVLVSEPPVHGFCRSVPVPLQTAISRTILVRSGLLRPRHCLDRTLISMSAMVNRLPCLGVWWISNRSSRRLTTARGGA